jgi:hypothetical protein
MLLVQCNGILLGSFVSRLRVTPHVLWYYLHASYLPRAWLSMDLNLAVACEVPGVVDELLMNPINFMLIVPLILSMVALIDFRKGFPMMMEVC